METMKYLGGVIQIGCAIAVGYDSSWVAGVVLILFVIGHNMEKHT
jgi:hypothetical protein